jgi:N-acyl-D-aspartate/D-glutamate deacylase
MKALLREGLAAGGLGFSTSLAESHLDAAGDPVPSRCAGFDEFRELAAICAEFAGTSVEMVPIAGAGRFPDHVAQLMIDLAVVAQRPLNWNTANVNANNGEELASKLAVSDRAQQVGAKIVGMFTPMPVDLRLNFASGFVLDMLPGWDKPMALPAAEKLEMLRSREGRETLRERAGDRARWTRWGDYEIHEAFTPATRRYEGRRVADIAEELGGRPYDALIDIVVTDELQTTFALPAIGAEPDDWKARGPMFRDPRVVVGASDAGAHLDMIDTFRYPTDVLSTCVREYQLLTTEEAVHSMTQVPAELIGLEGRGVIQEGALADIIVFDEGTVGSAALETRADIPGGGRRLFAESVGIHRVFVNGGCIVDHGEVSDRRPGRILRAGRDTRTPSLDL